MVRESACYEACRIRCAAAREESVLCRLAPCGMSSRQAHCGRSAAYHRRILPYGIADDGGAAAAEEAVLCRLTLGSVGARQGGLGRHGDAQVAADDGGAAAAEEAVLCHLTLAGSDG